MMPTFMPPRKQQRKKRSKKLRGKRRRLKNMEKFVPEGVYCYGFREDGKHVTCPFLRFDKNKHHQENGVCEAFGDRDDFNGGHLWDKVKMCNININYL